MAPRQRELARLRDTIRELELERASDDPPLERAAYDRKLRMLRAKHEQLRRGGI